MSQPTYVRKAKKRWKSLKKMLERFKRENGREMTHKELSARMMGGH